MRQNGLLTHYLKLALEKSGVKLDRDVLSELNDIEISFLAQEERLQDIEKRLKTLENA